MRGLLTARQYAECVALGAELLDGAALAPAVRAEVQTLYARSYAALGRNDAAADKYHLALELYAAAGDEQGLNRCRLGLARLRYAAGAYSAALQLLAQVRDAARRYGWEDIRAEALVLHGWIANGEHKYSEAGTVLAEAAPYFAAHPADPHEWEYQNASAWALIGAGELAAGEERARRACERLEAREAPAEDIALALNTLVFHAWCAGDFQRMLELQHQQLELVQEQARPQRLILLLYNSAMCETQLGRYAAAKRSLNRAWTIARREDERRVVPAILMLLTLTALHEDRPDMALEYAELARTDAQELTADEAARIAWYLAIAQLAAGQLAPAQAEWRTKRPLVQSIENWLEFNWLRGALLRVAHPNFAPQHPLEPGARSVAAAWEQELALLQAQCPAPPALAAPP